MRDVAALRAAVEGLRSGGRQVALVPTMGAFHEGHLSLMRLAGRGGHAVVVSLFVNPTQFGPGEDLAAYPRDEGRDLDLAAAEGVDLVFAPPAGVIYPEGFATSVAVGGPALGLEGAARPAHFAGVATVVAKLLLAVRPDRVVFGRKDAQQVAVVRRLMRDLHLDDVEMVVGPVVREPDGLAMSSRNAYLGREDRVAAAGLSRALAAARALADAGETDGPRIEAAVAAGVAAEPRVALEYAALVDPDTFARLRVLDRPALLCLAARVGPARLIDNEALIPADLPEEPMPPRSRRMLKSKIHRATVTDANLDYVGSITVDRALLAAADVLPYEQVHVLNLSTGARFETYAIEGPAGGGDICLNGAAARLAQPGDRVIVLTYAEYAEDALADHQPIVVHVDDANRPVPPPPEATVPATLPTEWGPLS
ncbi:MAG TPA: pantoate--beta-alanine ligase [Miltoncostaeaceae bacterium]|nr:pantoate--beta-alanine ligase [Miltoncostaeaceae bacterium]